MIDDELGKWKGKTMLEGEDEKIQSLLRKKLAYKSVKTEKGWEKLPYVKDYLAELANGADTQWVETLQKFHGVTRIVEKDEKKKLVIIEVPLGADLKGDLKVLEEHISDEHMWATCEHLYDENRVFFQRASLELFHDQVCTGFKKPASFLQIAEEEMSRGGDVDLPKVQEFPTIQDFQGKIRPAIHSNATQETVVVTDDQQIGTGHYEESMTQDREVHRNSRQAAHPVQVTRRVQKVQD
jgi:hypothetical protein